MKKTFNVVEFRYVGAEDLNRKDATIVADYVRIVWLI